ALARPARVRRAIAYGGGAILGALPALLFNQWAFGSPFKFSAYANLTAFQGAGQLHEGLYGQTIPSFHVAANLLFAPVGLLTLMPVLVAAAVGLRYMYDKGYRAEALVIVALAAANFLLISAKHY